MGEQEEKEAIPSGEAELEGECGSERVGHMSWGSVIADAEWRLSMEERKKMERRTMGE